MKEIEVKAPFCVLPWVHSHIHINGERKLCCFAEDFADPTVAREPDFEEFWNGPYMRGVRKLMLKGEAPAECSGCLGCPGELKRSFSPNAHWNQEYFHLIEKINSTTLPDGSYGGPPLFLDYRIGNQCNFSCRMCSSSFSSSIAQLEKMAKVENGGPRTQNSDKAIDSEFSRLLKSGKVEALYFASGEPFLSKSHWNILDELVASNLAAGIGLIYNSNLSIVTYKGTAIWERLRPFRKVQINASLDATGEVGEFIRCEMKWEVWRKNFSQWCEAIGRDNVCVSITLSIPALLNLKEMICFLDEVRVGYCLNLAYENGPERVFSPQSLSRDVLVSILGSVKVHVPQGDAYFSDMMSFLQDLQNITLAPESNRNWKVDLMDGFKFQMAIDAFRGKETTWGWYNRQPLLIPWLAEIMSVDRGKQVPIFNDQGCVFALRICEAYFSSFPAEFEEFVLKKRKRDSAPKEESSDLMPFSWPPKEGMIESLYLTSGAPFMSKFHWTLIEDLVMLDLARNIIINYDIGLNIFTHEGTPIRELLRPFRRVKMTAHIDSFDSADEFVRSPSKWADWRRSFTDWVGEFGRENVTLKIVLSIPALMNFKNFVDLLDEVRVDYSFSLEIERSPDRIFSPLALNRDCLEKILECALAQVPDDSPYFSKMAAFLQEMKGQLLLPESHINWQNELIEGFVYHMERDFKRGLVPVWSWYRDRPLLTPWLKEITGMFKGPRYPYYVDKGFNLSVIGPDLKHAEDFQNALAFPFHQTIIFRHNFHCIKGPDSYIQELFIKTRLPQLRLSIIDFAPSLFNRLLNVLNRKRVFRKDQLDIEGKVNLAMPANYLSRKIHQLEHRGFSIETVHTDFVPLDPKTLFQSRLLRGGPLAGILLLLGKRFPLIFSVHKHWVIDVERISSAPN